MVISRHQRQSPRRSAAALRLKPRPASRGSQRIRIGSLVALKGVPHA
jgi:hypothetical protein